MSQPNTPNPSVEPNFVRVYGNDHSPWVQSVLLGLHEKSIAHSSTPTPPPSVFLNSGVLMPAARLDDGPWLLDSENILIALGFSPVEPSDRQALRQAFGSALERTDSAWQFWYRWSLLRDEDPRLSRRLWNHVARAFSVFYFFMLITIARRRLSRPTDEQKREVFAYWERKLEAGTPFFGGESPDTVDLQLFGLVQMYASIPGPTLAVLQQDDRLQRLRDWIGRMQSRSSDYRHLYTGPQFEPHLPEIERSPLFERPFYWLGCAAVWLAFPLSVATSLYFARRVRTKGFVRT